MADKRKPGSKPGLIQCENCGEQYSDTYRRCPFCDEYDEYEDEASERPSSRGGKRLAQSRRRGGGYTRSSPLKIISVIISLAIILFAAWILIVKVMPLIQRSNVSTPSSNTNQNVSQVPDTSPNVTDAGPDSTPDVSDADPSVSDTPDVSPSPDSSPAPDGGGATGFSLSETEFAFSSRYPNPVTLTVTFTPTGSTGVITWSSSDPDIVSVDESGKVSPGSKTGTATITATLSNGVTQTCKVYNHITGSTSANTGTNSTAGSGSASGTYTVNNPDFTLYSVGETYQLKVSGYTGSISWSSSNTGIATVGSDGTVTATGSGKGSCTVTGTLDNGSTVTAIVRINIS